MPRGRAAAAAAFVCLGILRGQAPVPGDGPRYTPEGMLVKPEYREWVFLGSGLGMTYGPAAGGEPRFDNVFVSPSAYRRFVETGRWPDGTVFVLEVRLAESKGSINQGGHYQAGVAAVEVHVKDEKRFPSKWGFFAFPENAATARVIPPGANCYSCHEQHGAVDTTFVQFYPTVSKAAKDKGTYQER
jgi:hypothetical protein